MDPAMVIEVAAMSRQRALEEAIARGDSDIQRFYCNSTVFITGGSGFMGKQMIEKLLRSCQVSKVLVLIRPRKGKQIKERLNEIFQDPVFEKLRQHQPDFEERVAAIKGDAAEMRLGIDETDWATITEEVDVIYHMAATTRFDVALRIATLINVRGTRETLMLAKSCRKLKSFVHISTAFAHARYSLVEQDVKEEFFPSPIPAETLISLVETMEESRLNDISATLIQDWPNTYTFAKTVAEDLVRTMSDGLPICIIRPGIVIATYREPSPGWLDVTTAYGASGLVLGTGLGLIHVVRSNSNANFALVPCDFVNNAIIAAGKEAQYSSGGETTKIYAVSTSTRNTVTQGDFASMLTEYGKNIISPEAVYYIFAFRTPNKLLYLILTWLLHYIPAYTVDFICYLLGKERRFVKTYKKIYSISNALTYFTLNGWQFVDKNLENLNKSLSKTDKVIFNFDMTCIDWREYTQIWCIGIRKYIIKDGLRRTQYAIRKQFWLRILNCIVTVVYLYCFWKLFCIISLLF